MLAVPSELVHRYEAWLAHRNVMTGQRPHYHKWLRYYLDFCHKYGFAPTARPSLPAFQEKLRAKLQPEPLRQQAEHAVSLYWQMVAPSAVKPRSPQAIGTPQKSEVGRTAPGAAEGEPNRRPAEKPRIGIDPTPAASSADPARQPEGATVPFSRPSPPAPVHRFTRQETDTADGAPSLPAKFIPARSRRESAHPVGSDSTGACWMWVYDGLSSAIKVRHYSSKTLEAYQIWTRKFQTFTRSKNPRSLSMEDVKGFLSFLATHRKIAASSQNQAFNALLFLFKHVLEKEFGKVEGVVRAKRKPYIPTVLSREEVDRIVARLDMPYALVAKLLYGCGLRLFECLKLRVQDLNFAMRVLTVHDGKGQKDRTVPLPEALVVELRTQLDEAVRVHEADLAAGYAGTFLPAALGEKYPRAAKELGWQWLFPATTLTRAPDSGDLRRAHLHETRVDVYKRQHHRLWQRQSVVILAFRQVPQPRPIR